MGNTVVIKGARFGALTLQMMLEDFRDCFPAGVINTINGDGPTVIGPLMASPETAGWWIDHTAQLQCRLNLNSQCQRGPDVFPFTGRKDSAEGTLSISDALRCFSIRSMVAVKKTPANIDLAQNILSKGTSNFFSTRVIL